MNTDTGEIFYGAEADRLLREIPEKMVEVSPATAQAIAPKSAMFRKKFAQALKETGDEATAMRIAQGR